MASHCSWILYLQPEHPQLEECCGSVQVHTFASENGVGVCSERFVPHSIPIYSTIRDILRPEQEWSSFSLPCFVARTAMQNIVGSENQQRSLSCDSLSDTPTIVWISKIVLPVALWYFDTKVQGNGLLVILLSNNNSQIASLTIESLDYTTTSFACRSLWIDIAERSHSKTLFVRKGSFVECVIKIFVVFLFQVELLALCEVIENHGIVTSSRNVMWLIANILPTRRMERRCFGARLEK
jgi:hypothetical protein